MDQDQIWRQFLALPPHAQQQVADFITFLHTSMSQATHAPSVPVELADEPFVGMWQDRDDLADSSTWVRHVRAREWTQAHD